MATETASSNGGCTLTREELLGTTNLKAREWRHIDPEIWDDDIEAPNDEIDETAATTYIARAIADYTDRPTADAELFGEFLQDFQGWTEAMFMRANATYTKELKRILRFKGVFTGRVNMPPSEAVAKLLRKEECPKWPDDQFQSTAFDERSAAHMLQQYRLKGRHNTGTAQPTSRAQSQTSARTRDQDAEEQQTDAQVENRTSAQVNQQLAREGRQRTSPLVETIEQTPQTNERRQADQRQQSQQPRMTTESPPAPSMVKRSEAIQKATKALRKLTAERQVADALNTRNGPATADMLALPLQSEVLVWRESDGWNGPYKIASIDGHNVTVDMVNGPVTFRSTVVKPYYRPDHLWSDPDAPYTPKETHEPQEPMAVPMAAQPRKRGRPPRLKEQTQGTRVHHQERAGRSRASHQATKRWSDHNIRRTF